MAVKVGTKRPLKTVLGCKATWILPLVTASLPLGLLVGDSLCWLPRFRHDTIFKSASQTFSSAGNIRPRSNLITFANPV